MKTSDFFNLLETNKDKALLFTYSLDKWIGANYHITEVKHVKIDSVDCGSGTDAWNETLIQIWENPSEMDKTEFMSVYKALAILNKVGKMKPYDLNAELKIEYGNNQFHTAQFFISDYSIWNGQLQLHLSIEKTNCKAKETCGVNATVTHEPSRSCAPDSICC